MIFTNEYVKCQRHLIRSVTYAFRKNVIALARITRTFIFVDRKILFNNYLLFNPHIS